jgi:transcription-repair coupling factor (superfamily II helicase)
MDRLICGDVGFGKTEVAMRALYRCTSSGKQAVLLAPTTVLAAQHYRSALARFKGFGVRIVLMSRHLSARDKKEAIEAINEGDVDLVVGTHAALGARIKYPRLGMIVVDEEQRFGVNQKEKLKSMRTGIDVLTLTATPIPRTLQMALTGLREMSVLQTPPPSRKPVETLVRPATDSVIAKAIGKELARGGQVYCVAPRIGDLESIAGRVGKLFPEISISIAHGEHADVEDRLLRFSEGGSQVLVCTSIIESGLDISTVNTIIIFSAHMFGLSSLYQLRGRVGRGRLQAQAVLTFEPGYELSDDGKNRMESMQEFSQLGAGFQLAQRDLEIRGAGSMLGADQSGEVNSVGFELYTELLHKTIIEIRGAKARGEIENLDDVSVAPEPGPGEASNAASK